MTIREPERLRAEVAIRGAVTEYVYGTNQKSVLARAIKKLTTFEPGIGNLYPQYVAISRKTQTVSVNEGRWEEIARTTIDQIPEEKHEWRRRAAAQKVRNL